MLVLSGRSWRQHPAVSTTGRRWPISTGFASAESGRSGTEGRSARVLSLAEIAACGHWSSSPHCSSCAPALLRIRPVRSSPIGSAASRSLALKACLAAAPRAVHRRAIVRSPTTRPMPTVAIGLPSRANGSRCHPTRSCSVPTTRPGAALPACAIMTGIRSCGVLSEPPKAEGKCTITTGDPAVILRSAPLSALGPILGAARKLPTCRLAYHTTAASLNTLRRGR